MKRHLSEIPSGHLNPILDLIFQLASGNFEARLDVSARGDDYDALSMGLNMLAEELGSSVRERERALALLSDSEMKFRAITDTALDAVILIDDDGAITLWNPAAEKVFGYSEEEAIGKNVHLWLAPSEYHDSYKRNWPDFRETGKGPVIGETFQARANSRARGEIPVELSISSAYLNGRWYAIGIARDISERKAMEKSVSEEREILRAIDTTLSSFICGTDTGRAFEIVLGELLKLTGSECGFLQDRHIDEDGQPYVRILALSDRHLSEDMKWAWENRGADGFRIYDLDGLNNLPIVTGDVVIANDPDAYSGCGKIAADRRETECFLGIPLKRGDETIGSIGLANRECGYQDRLVKQLAPLISAISEIVQANQNEEARRKSEKRTQKMARFDELTGLPNRSQFKERLHELVNRAHRYSETCALLLLDLDHFKDVNDTLGHPVGDALLQAVGKRLKSVVRTTDTVARLGGDEFAVLQSNLTGTEDAAALARRLIDVLAKPFNIDGHRIHTETSIGIALCEPGNLQPNRLFSQADTALYRAKSAGRHRFCFHDFEIEREVHRRVTLMEELHEAVAEEQFVIHYQPQVDIHTRRLVGVEALLRWNHPRRGLLGPGAFIQAAEQTGFLLEIDKWVLRHACRQMADWQRRGLMKTATISINLSPLQFKTADFESNLLATLEDEGLAPRSLELEITERSVAERPETVAALIKRLTALGIRFAIDDFGTGYSSLQYLKKLPVSKIKVAQEFVRDMLADASDASIVRAIISLGQELGYDVIAEGVETKEQLDFLQSKGCRLFQGYLFGKPKPASELAGKLRQSGHALSEGWF